MRCLVTGVAGFIGSHLAERLLNDGHTVIGVDVFTDYYSRTIKERNIKHLRSREGMTLIEENLLHMNLCQLLDGVDWVFHQSAQAGVRASWGDEFAIYVDANIQVTQRLLEAAKRTSRLQRFVYASSSSAYGDALTLPVSETAVCRPYSPYGVTKLAAEHLCSLYHANFGVPTVSLRYFTVYGPRQRPDMAFHRFCKAVFEDKPIHLYGDGEQTRDFTYITDIVEANIRSATTPEAVGKVMNIAGGSRISLRDVVRLLQEISHSTIRCESNESQHGDVRHTFADITLAETTLGYAPVVSLEEGLTREFHDIVALYSTALLPNI
ncbi:MAG: NAD-dependent epimerase/dehydratase family protein [Ktedonobacteraceae bacterium]